MNKLYHGLKVPAGPGDPIAVSAVVVDSARASAVLAECQFDKQRAVREKKVRHYARVMESGQWPDGTTIQFAFNREMGLRLIDGQHRLSAVVASGATLPFTALVHWAKDEVDAGRLYSGIDLGMKRSDADQLHALSVDYDLGLSKTETNYAVAWTYFAVHGCHGSGNQTELTVAEKGRLLYAFKDAIDLYISLKSEFASPLTASPARRRAVGAVAILTLHYSMNEYGLDTVGSFWEGLLSGYGLEKGDPRAVAHRHLVTTAMVGNSPRKANVVGPGESARALAHCFNAHVESRPLTFTRVYDVAAPINLKGTPYNGKRSVILDLDRDDLGVRSG